MRQIPRTALLILAPFALWIALTSWAFASPVGSSPDDDYHMASIWCGGGEKEGLCEAGDSVEEMQIPYALLAAPGCYAFQPQQSADCALAPSDHLVNTSRGNFAGSYPPVYYATLSMFVSPNIEASIVAMRVFNATLYVGILSYLFVVLPARLKTPLLWSVTATIVPLGMFIVASVNPSSWSVLAGAGLWVVLTAFYDETRKKRRVSLAFVAILLAIMGAGARADSAIYAGIAVLVAASLAFEKTRRFALASLLGIAVIAISLFFFFSSGQSALLEPAAAEGQVSFMSLVFGNLVSLPELWSGVFGTTGLGWLDTNMPGFVWFPALVIFAGLSFWGMHVWSTRKAFASFIVAFGLIIVPMYVLVHDEVMIPGPVQARYIYPLVIMLLGVLLVRLKDPSLGLHRAQILTIVAFAALANTIALHYNIRRYVTGVDVASPNLDSGAEWWWSIPVGPIWVWAIGSAAFGVYALSVHSVLSPFVKEELKPLEAAEAAEAFPPHSSR